jgi:prolyl-tRNA synthetase
MRWTNTIIPTLKEAPSDAEIHSHKLLIRAGLVRKLTAGLYTFLPIGLRVLHKIEKIVREEMDRAGGLETLMPALQPPEIWQKSGRYETARDVLFKAKDRSDKEWVLGPTHEEVITTLVAGELQSYRQYPKTFYQIQTKFRDEIRPRFGLMRAKEFIMKDAYSFDTSDDASQISYKSMYDAYARIFKRCGLTAFAVEADTGVMGGKFSHEYMVPAETGENEVVYNEESGYAANIEKAVTGSVKIDSDPALKDLVVEKFETTKARTIEALTREPYSVPATQQIKTLVYVLAEKPLIVLMRGDDQLNEAKLTGLLGSAEFRPATEEEIVSLLGAKPGSLGAVSVTGIPVYGDLTLQGCWGMVTGANEDGFHLRNVNIKRDIADVKWVDLRTAKAGDPCPKSGNPLKIQRAIEVGHVFKLGTKYSEALGASFLDQDGKTRPAVMGCYGIGVTRTLQAVIEQSSDKFGVIWPLSIAPYQVCLTPLTVDPDSEVMKLTMQFYKELTDKGVEVIVDDRDERPGVKFKDSELVGFPIRLAVGEKSLAQGVVELKMRAGGEMEKIAPESAIATIMERIQISTL